MLKSSSGVFLVHVLPEGFQKKQYAQPELCFELDAGVLETSFPGRVNSELNPRQNS
jgi:hypothetical protein